MLLQLVLGVVLIGFQQLLSDVRPYVATLSREELDEAKKQADKAVKILRDLVDYFLDRPEDMPDTYRHKASPIRTQVLDFVAGMTDRYALRVHDELFRPAGMV